MLATVPWAGQTVQNIKAVEVALVVARYFPVEARQTAMCIGYWETRGEPYSNDLVGAAGEVSVWQIHPIHFNRFDRRQLIVDMGYATWAARQLYDESGFAPWSTAPLCKGDR